MVKPYITNTTIDSGQLKMLNAKNDINKAPTKLQVLNSAQNWQRNQPLTNQMDIDESNDVFHDEDTIEQQDNSMNDKFENTQNKQSNIKGLSFEIEFEIDDVNDHYVATSIMFVSDLLKRWLKSNAIEGVLAQDNSMIVNRIEDYQAWAIPPKIIHRK